MDLINRRAAIDAVLDRMDVEKWGRDAKPEEIQWTLEKLPSAEKTGKWVNNINDMPICNQCGYMTPYDRAIDDYEYGNFCPNCGAKMEDD